MKKHGIEESKEGLLQVGSNIDLYKGSPKKHKKSLTELATIYQHLNHKFNG